MKRFICAMLCVFLLFQLALPAFAEERDLVWDETLTRDAEVVKALNKTATTISEKYKIRTLLVYVAGDAADADKTKYLPEEKDWVLFVVGEENNRFYTGGLGDVVFADPDDRDRMGYVYDEMNHWDEAGERYFEVLEEYLKDYEESQAEKNPPVSSLPISSSQEDKTDDEEGSPYAWVGYFLPAAAVFVIAVALFVRKKNNK